MYYLQSSFSELLTGLMAVLACIYELTSNHQATGSHSSPLYQHEGLARGSMSQEHNSEDLLQGERKTRMHNRAFD